MVAHTWPAKSSQLPSNRYPNAKRHLSKEVAICTQPGTQLGGMFKTTANFRWRS